MILYDHGSKGDNPGSEENDCWRAWTKDQDPRKGYRDTKRLYFIRYRYQGDSVETAAERVVVYKIMAYQWQDRWNRDGYAGLIPRFAGGKPSRLSPVKMERLRSILEERDDWTTEDVQNLIERRFGIRFTQKHVRTILRKLGMKYAKPYQHYYRRSDHRFPGWIVTADHIQYSEDVVIQKTGRSGIPQNTEPIHLDFTQSTETVS